MIRYGQQINLAAIWKDYWGDHHKSAPGTDGVTPQKFNEDLQKNLRSLRTDLCNGYTYSALRGLSFPKKDPSKKRLICIPTVRDRLVQRALLKVIESKTPQLGIANEVSFGFVRRINGGAHNARKIATSLEAVFTTTFG
ncbi:MAG: hypothetical protein JO007_01910 [Alphaproteobacteria bacterium]|nr:hypothetical protein [Alphaproteobacteria bacterium]